MILKRNLNETKMDITYFISLLLLFVIFVYSVTSEDVLITITKNKNGLEKTESAIIGALLAQHQSDTITDFIEIRENPESPESEAADKTERLEGTDRKHKRRHQRTDRKRNGSVNKSCCVNGGLCVLGSFCHCRKNFYGRFCELDRREQDCGEVKHDEMVRRHCDLCHCLHGALSCLPRIFHGCDDEQSETQSQDVQVNEDNKEKQEELNERTIIDEEIRKVMSEYSSESRDYTNSASHLNCSKDIVLLIGCLLISFYQLSDSVR